jgi:hypothetical protein
MQRSFFNCDGKVAAETSYVVDAIRFGDQLEITRTIGLSIPPNLLVRGRRH